MNTTEVVADLRATIDYLADITENVDTMSFEDMVSVQDEARQGRLEPARVEVAGVHGAQVEEDGAHAGAPSERRIE